MINIFQECAGRFHEFHFYERNFLDVKAVGSTTWNLPLLHPFHLSTLIMFISHVVLTPFGYYRIFTFRKKNDEKMAGSISAVQNTEEAAEPGHG